MSSRDAKRRALLLARALNPHPERVRAASFLAHPFFDAEDKPQVKYEMLRLRELEASPLHQACADFGSTRESYRHLLERFRSEGMAGLFERKRGRKAPLKANDKVRQFLHREHAQTPTLPPEELARRCQRKMGVSVSRRTVYRVLAEPPDLKKKRHRQPRLPSRRPKRS